MQDKSEPICPECHVGRMQKGRVSYLNWINGRLITVPDFPAWICDICGSYEYEHGALIELQAMLRLSDPRIRKAMPSKPDASASQGSSTE